MKRWLPFLILLLTVLPVAAAEIRLSAAASMSDALRELCAAYERLQPGTRCLTNFGASGTLAKQIAEGAPADLFVSANPEWMSFLADRRKLSPEPIRSLASNTLVFVGTASTRAASLEDLPGLERIAIGSPGSVPAGRYAEQALQAAGLYGRLLTEGKLVMAQDVRQALVYADRGEVDGAFVYRTDALLAKKARILFEVAPKLHDRVVYPFSLTAAGTRNPAAVAFRDFLRTPAARKILEDHGFAVR